MKKFFFFFMAVLPVVFTACSDDDEPTINQEEIVGTWKPTSATADVTGTGGALLQPTFQDVIDAQLGDGSEFVFQSNGTFTSSMPILPGGTYTVDGNKLTMKYGDYTINGTISKLDENELKVSIDVTEMMEMSGSGINVYIKLECVKL